MTHRQFLSGEEACFKAANALSEEIYTYKSFNDSVTTENVWKTRTVQSIIKQDLPFRHNIASSAFIQASSLIGAIPQLYKLTQDKTGVVIHVAAENPKSAAADFSHIMSAREAVPVILCSSTVQETHDLAIIAHTIAIKKHTPVLHFFDGKRISEEHVTIDLVQDFSQLLSQEDLDEFKQYQVEQHIGAYVQYKQQAEIKQENNLFKSIAEIMSSFSTLTGRNILPLEYTGHSQAENVVIAMGAGASIVKKVVNDILASNKDSKIGVLKVSLYRPWSNLDLLNLLPRASLKRVTILEPSSVFTHLWNPLFLDVTAALQLAEFDHVDISSGRYGVEAEDLKYGQVFSLFDSLSSGSSHGLDVNYNVADLNLLYPTQGIPDALKEGLYFAGDLSIFTGDLKLQAIPDRGFYHVRLNSFISEKIYKGKYAIVDTLNISEGAIHAVSALAPAEGTIIFYNALNDLESLPEAFKRAVATSGAKLVSVESIKELPIEGIQGLLAKAKSLSVPATWSQLVGQQQQQQQQDTSKVSQVLSKSDSTLPIETPYLKMLDQVFQERLQVANAIHSASVWSRDEQNPSASAPEYGYGKILNQIQERTRFIDEVENLIKKNLVSQDVYKALSQWVLAVKSSKSDIKSINKAAETVLSAILESPTPAADYVLKNKDLLFNKSNWLIGSDSWAYDLGQSGIHHVISQGENVNMLIVDTLPYSSELEREQRKKDIGLYAMNFGNAYVASVAVYSSYTGVLHALMEADAYQGPSIVLAYLPQEPGSKTVNPLFTMKETKVSVDNGAWPLYRWNPALDAEGKEAFSLDSQRIKKDLEKFLERENHFSQIVAQHPDISQVLVSSLEKDVTKRHQELKRKAREDFAKLLSGMGAANGPPLTVLFGSDNGNAEGVAKKIANRAKSRGLQVKFMAMDDYESAEELANETNVVFVISTAGQGELPSNARELWKALNSLNAGDVNFAELNYAVFAMGDSHYWPRPEDAGFYNRPGKIIDAKLENLGANRLISIGLGDDQDADGFETALGVWQPEFWKSLGVKDVGAEDDEPKLTDDQMKINSNFLRGTIAEDLLDESTGAIGEINGKLLKFHGSYGQDDRDIREERKKMGLEKAFSFMIRVRMPGGVATPAQWLMMDELAETHANGAIKMTTRQAFQLHGILKKDLRNTIRGINHALLSTLAACGDVNRNIMITPVTEIPEVHPQVQDFGMKLMEHLAPKTTAYHEIWLADKQVAGNAVQDFEPIYGPTYLPRKFKIVIAVPPNNDVDIFAHDLGYIAIVDANKKVIGYNVTIGGGMGMTHGNKKTYPRPANLVGYVPAELAVACGEAVMTTQRDFGDRTNRKHARFKYTIDTHGLDFIVNEIETRMGTKFQPAAEYHFTDNADRYGWTKGIDDKWHFCMFIENGKIKDWPDFQPKTGLRELAKWHKGEFRLSPNQHLVIADVPEADLEKTKALLAKYKMDNLSFTGLRLNAMACVALPTCGLAMAESERYLPTLVGHLEGAIESAGLKDDAITIRMTGCPNGCARPYVAEIAFVGKAPGTYNVYLGGGHKGERLNKLYKESLKEEEILSEINPIIKRYALERQAGEPFGDFVIRAGYVKKTITGTDFHEL